MEGDDGPRPGAEVEDGEDSVDREDPGSDVGAGLAGLVGEQGTQRRTHQGFLRPGA